MPTNTFLYTGAWTLAEPDAPRRNFGLVAASSAFEGDGVLRVDLPERVLRRSDEAGVTVLLSEAQGRELVAVLERTLERIAHLRALHRLSLLREEAYVARAVDDDGSSTDV